MERAAAAGASEEEQKKILDQVHGFSYELLIMHCEQNHTINAA